MTPHPAQAEPQPPADLLPEHLAEDRQYHRHVLNELIDIGADFARLLHQQAKAQAQAWQPGSSPAAQPASPEITLPDLCLADLTIAFDRVARAVRRTVALARKLAETIPAQTATDLTRTRILARKRIIREVEDQIQRRLRGPEAETLHDEFSARLDAPDLEDDIENRPVADIIADICHDLGLTNLPGSHLWKRRTPEDVASLCARAARPRIPAASPISLRPKPPRPHPATDPPWRSKRTPRRAAN